MSEGQKMSTDKLQATIAEILSEPPVTSTTTEPSPLAFCDEEPAPPTLSNQPNNVEPAVETAAVDPPTDAESAVRRAQQANSFLIVRRPPTATLFPYATLVRLCTR